MERQETKEVLLRLKLIGSIEAVDSSGNNLLPASRKPRALLSYLALNAGQWVPRSRITRLLWDRVPEEQGRASLRQALHELSRAMGPVYPKAIEAERERLRLKSETVWVDALVVATAAVGGALDELRDLNVFSGSLLLDGLDNLSDEFDHWLVAERQKLEERIRRWNEARIQTGLQDPVAPQRRVEMARSAVAVDPTNEEAVRELMRALAGSGQRAQAMHEYERCRAILRSRLDLDPAPETQRLYRDLRRATAAAQVSEEPVPDPVSPQQIPPSNRSARSAAEVDASRSEAVAAPVHVTEIAEPHFRLPLKVPKDRPSIAVLPFANLGPKDSEGYFSDGLVEDIVVSLGNLRELFVISRASTLAYRGGGLDVPQVAHELGVRYVVSGSVRRSQQRLRISATLSDTETSTDLWSDRTEAALGDLFDVQDNVVERIVCRIAPHVQAAELKRSLRRRPENFTAYDYTLQALDLIFCLDIEGFSQARIFLQKAMDVEAGFAMPHAWAARWHSLRVGQGWSPDTAQDSTEAVRLAARAIRLDRQNALALATYGHMKSFLYHEYDSGLVYLERAIAACPNSAVAWALSSITHSYIGNGVEAVRRAEHGLRLSPFDPALYYYYTLLSLAHYASENYGEAIRWGRLAMSENATFTATLRYLTAALAASGALQEAQRLGRRLLERETDFSLQTYRSLRLPFRDKPQRERHLEHLRKAGLPE